MRGGAILKTIATSIGLFFFWHLASASSEITAVGDTIEKVHFIPVVGSKGESRKLEARVCIPSGSRSATAIILNHGSPSHAKDRKTISPYLCNTEFVQWFVSRGYVVVSPLRRGYGANGGEWDEGFGTCKNPDYLRAGLETARDISAVVEYSIGLPEVRKDQVVVVGQSAGGWGSIALNSTPHPKVKAIINFAGGRGVLGESRKSKVCTKENLLSAAKKYGATSTTEMLWIYSMKDNYFPPELVQSIYQAFIGNGGKASLVQLSSSDKEGHFQFTDPGGTQKWGTVVESYLKQMLK